MFQNRTSIIDRPRNKKRCLIGLLTLMLMLTAWPVAAQEHIWSNGYGGPGKEYGCNVAADDAGNSYVVGYFDDSLNLGGGTLVSAGYDDVFLAKFDADGNHIWSQRFGSAQPAQGWGVCVDSAGSVYMTGYFYGNVDFGGGTFASRGMTDIFLCKYDTNGLHVWSKRMGYGNEDDQPYNKGFAVVVDDANVYVCGSFQLGINLGGSDIWATGGTHDQDAFVAAYAADDGAHVWSAGYGDINEDQCRDVCVDSDGEVFIIGTLVGTTSLDQAFLAKYSASGSQLWSNIYGDNSFEQGISVDVDAGDNVLLTGRYSGRINFGGGNLPFTDDYDLFLTKVDNDGNWLWHQAFGSEWDDAYPTVAVDPDDDVFVTGGFFEDLPLDCGTLVAADYDSFDVYLIKFAGTDGANQWGLKFGEGRDDSGMGLATDTAGNVIMTGFYQGNADFGGGPLVGHGGTDVMLARYEGDPAFKNIDVVTTHNAATNTYDATLTFDTSWPATPTVDFDPIGDCFPACGYGESASGSMATDHSVVLANIPATREVCYQINATSGDGQAVCWPTNAGTFNTTGGPAKIYSIFHSFNAVSCRIKVMWKTGFRSENNKVKYHKVGQIIWSTVAAVGVDCLVDEYYTAFFSVAAAQAYEFRIYTTIDGVEYQSSLQNRTSGRCDEDPPVPHLRFAGGRALDAPFVVAHPNPFNPTTTFSFNMLEPGEVHLDIYSVDGRKVRTLLSRSFPAGLHHCDWSGTNDCGGRVATGVYFVRLATGAEVLTQKIVMLK